MPLKKKMPTKKRKKELHKKVSEYEIITDMSLLRLQPMPVLFTWQISDDKTEKDKNLANFSIERWRGYGIERREKKHNHISG